MSKILVEHGEYVKIATIFNCTHRTVRDACKGKTNSKLANKIRMCALERGGAEVETKQKQKIV